MTVNLHTSSFSLQPTTLANYIFSNESSLSQQLIEIILLPSRFQCGRRDIRFIVAFFFSNSTLLASRKFALFKSEEFSAPPLYIHFHLKCIWSLALNWCQLFWFFFMLKNFKFKSKKIKFNCISLLCVYLDIYTDLVVSQMNTPMPYKPLILGGMFQWQKPIVGPHSCQMHALPLTYIFLLPFILFTVLHFCLLCWDNILWFPWPWMHHS